MTKRRAAPPDDAQPDAAQKRRERRRLWIVLAIVAAVVLICVLLTPRWARSYTENVLKRSLAEQGWQVNSLHVEAVGFGQAKLSGIAMESRYAKITVPEVSATFGLYDLLAKQRLKGVIVSRARVEAHWAHTAADLVGAALLPDWPQERDSLPFDRLYLSDAELIPQASSGISGVRVNAILETVPRNATARKSGGSRSNQSATGNTAEAQSGSTTRVAATDPADKNTARAYAANSSLPSANTGSAASRRTATAAGTQPHSANARLWADFRIPSPTAHAVIDAEIDFKTRSLRATLEGDWKELGLWRELPLPPQAQAALAVVRERLALQAGVSLRGRTVTNWMIFGQSPAVVYTAPDGTHIEAVNADFGLNVIGADRFDYGWLRAESGAAQHETLSLEWQMLHAELKSGSHFSAHAQSAQIRAELSSIARELMPQNKIATEFAGYWRNEVWQAENLFATLLAPQVSPEQQPMLRLGGRLKIGPFAYPWEKTFSLKAEDLKQWQKIPLLRPLLGDEEPDAQEK